MVTAAAASSCRVPVCAATVFRGIRSLGQFVPSHSNPIFLPYDHTAVSTHVSHLQRVSGEAGLESRPSEPKAPTLNVQAALMLEAAYISGEPAERMELGKPVTLRGQHQVSLNVA